MAAAGRHLHQRVRHRGRGAVQPEHRGPPRPDGRPRAASLRFVMSVRGIGEGHRSSHRVPHRRRRRGGDASRSTTPGPFATPARVDAGRVRPAASSAVELARLGDGRRDRQLRARRARRPVHPRRARRAARQPARRSSTPARHAHDTVAAAPRDRRRQLRASTSPPTRELSERVLWPRWRPSRTAWRTRGSSASSTTTARVTYYATYTAYDGIAHQPAAAARPPTSSRSRPRRWSGRPPPTRAWRCSRAGSADASPPCRGPTARRTPSPSPTTSRHWDGAVALPGARPRLGGRSSSATAARPSRPRPGWLVLTHGVGPMRTYSIGAHPARPRRPHAGPRSARRAAADPRADEQDGYVPNVVYSCGALVHADTLVLPTASATRRSAWPPVSWPELRRAMR